MKQRACPSKHRALDAGAFPTRSHLEPPGVQDGEEQGLLIKLLHNHMSTIKDIFKVFSSMEKGGAGDIDLKEWLNLAKVRGANGCQRMPTCNNVPVRIT